MKNKEYYFNWFFVFAISSIFASNYFYLFSNGFTKDQKVQNLEIELQRWELMNNELIDEILQLRKEIQALKEKP